MHNQRHLGSKLVRIAGIQASENHSRDFDRNFHPLETHTKSRWLSIAVAHLNGQAMPAVDLIKVGEVYAVRDGHHRISVARALGENYINAHVTAWEPGDCLALPDASQAPRGPPGTPMDESRTGTVGPLRGAAQRPARAVMPDARQMPRWSAPR